MGNAGFFEYITHPVKACPLVERLGVLLGVEIDALITVLVAGVDDVSQQPRTDSAPPVLPEYGHSADLALG